MSTIAPASLPEQLGADYNATPVTDGTAPTADHFVNWAVTPDGIRMTFNQYQVTAARGPLLSVVEPWGPLRQVIVRTSPVAKIAGLARPPATGHVSPGPG